MLNAMQPPHTLRAMLPNKLETKLNIQFFSTDGHVSGAPKPLGLWSWRAQEKTNLSKLETLVQDNTALKFCNEDGSEKE